MTKPFPVPPSSISGGRARWVAVAAVLVAALGSTSVVAQAPAAPTEAAAPAPAEELESLVARIALYPDDLVGIILPGSTNPLQIVQADRFLEKRKTDKNAKLDDKWDDAVKSLLNYPEVVKMMSSDLDWTAALGEAVVADLGEVMAAVQSFRRKTQSAGNLKSDQKQTVVVEKEVIKIVPADPQVIYVPQYDPATVVVAGYYPSWGYYPAPYPVYYYPYAPGAAFAAGVIWGAAIGAAWGGGHYGCGWGGNNDITINRGGNTVNIGSGNVGSGNRGGNASTKWNSGKQPGQVSHSVGKTPSASNRVGDSRGAGAGGARPSTQQAGGLGGGDRAGGGAGAGAGGGARASAQPSGGGSAFDGAGSSGRQTSMDSSRGASSRGSAGAMSSGSRPSAGAAGRSGGGSMGGGARAGGGGGRGGGRR